MFILRYCILVPLMDDPKAVSKSVSLLPDLWERVDAKAKASHGSRSDYIRELITADMQPDKLPGTADSDCLVRLCEAFAPTYTGEMRKMVNGLDQPKALESLLKLFATGAMALKPSFLLAAEDHPAYGARKK